MEEQKALSGKSFCITGTLMHSRKIYIDFIKKHGGRFIREISNNVNFVIAGTDAFVRDTVKLDHARDLDLFIIDEQKLFEMAGSTGL